MREILAIVRDACDRRLLHRPASIAGSDRMARLARVAANDTAEQIAKRALGGQGWTTLQATWVFRLEPGVASYRLPPDFGRMIPDTAHRQRWSIGLLGPASIQIWHHWLYGISAPASAMAWRVMNGRLHVEPAPTVAEYATIGYVSKWPVIQPVDGADHLQAGVSAEEAQDVVLPLVAREGYVATNADALGMTPDEFAAMFRRLQPTQGVDVASEAQARKERFTADTDIPVFDAHLMGLGITWRLLAAMSRPYIEEKAEFEEALEVALSTDGGGAQTISLGPCDEPEPVVFLGDGRYVIR